MLFSTKRRVPRGRAPVFEEIEARRLYTVTVSEGFTGFYLVEGDEEANAINISVDQEAGTFTLDDVTYENVQQIQVNAYGGDDTVSVLSTGTGNIAAIVIGGDGNDNIEMNFAGHVEGNDGNDTIHLSDAFFGAAIGGAGNDSMYISGDCVSASILGDDGNDFIDCRNNNAPVTIRGGAGNDTIWGSPYDDEIWGDDGTDIMHGAGGNDMFYARDNCVDYIDGGSGEDGAYVDWNDISGFVEHVDLA